LLTQLLQAGLAVSTFTPQQQDLQDFYVERMRAERSSVSRSTT
jgi:hypothetical protein